MRDRSSGSRRGIVLGLLAALAVALVTLYYLVSVPALDVNRWQRDIRYRDIQRAEAAGIRVQGLSVEATVSLLGVPDHRNDAVLRYRLSESCGPFLPLDPCDLVLFVEEGRVSGAALDDTGAPPGQARRCVAGVC